MSKIRELVMFKNLFSKYPHAPLLTFTAGVAMVVVGGVCAAKYGHIPSGWDPRYATLKMCLTYGLLALPFGVVFSVLGGLTLLFHASDVKLRKHQIIITIVGLIFILFAMFLWGYNSSTTPVTLVVGTIIFAIGCFPWAYRLPSYVSLIAGVVFLSAAWLAGAYVPLIIRYKFAGDETPAFIIHQINFTFGVFGIALILAGAARFFRFLLCKTDGRK